MTNRANILLSHPTGTPFAGQVAQALFERGMLAGVTTAFRFSEEGRLRRILRHLPERMEQIALRELRRREWLAPTMPVICFPWKEVVRMVLMKSGICKIAGVKPSRLVDWIYEDLDRRTAALIEEESNIGAVYAYEDGAADSFQVAKGRGVQCLYDLPIMYWREAAKIQFHEAERFPELACSLQAAREPQYKLERKDQEVRLADHIFVASTLTKRSLVVHGIDEDKITIVPYGAPTADFVPLSEARSQFRFLFVGRVGPRKGVHHLLAAWNAMRVPNAELVLVGVNEFPDGWLEAHLGSARYIPSLPHRQLPKIMAHADVLLLPSLVEGFGMVLLEAMACGVAVIASSNTAAPDLIGEGEQGFIIPPGDPEVLRERMLRCYEDRELTREMGNAAYRLAVNRTWEAYRNKVACSIHALTLAKVIQ